MTDVFTATASPARVMELARDGRVPNSELAALLNPIARKTFLNYCSSIERRYTAACGEQGDPCLADGCAMQGETCLQPLERANADYGRACGHAFLGLYLDPKNRL
jgi:hypothetical protein